MKRIFVERDNGDVVDITDLNKEEYEEFLSKVKALEILYNVMKTR